LVQAQRERQSQPLRWDGQLSVMGWQMPGGLDLDPVLLGGMPALLNATDWQTRLLGHDLTTVDLDTRQLTPAVALNQDLDAMRWLAALERLCCLHLFNQQTDRLHLETLVLGVFDTPDQHYWFLNLRCRGQLSPQTQAEINQHWQHAQPGHDFSRDLQMLYGLNPENTGFRLQPVADEVTLSQQIVPGVNGFEIAGKTHLVILLTPSPQTPEQTMDYAPSYLSLMQTLRAGLQTESLCD